MLTLKLELGKIKSKIPQGNVVFNGVLIHSGEYNRNYIKLDPVIGKNTLNVSLSNKKDRDTKLQGNRIIEDVYVKVVDIVCDITKDSAGHLDTIGKYKTSLGENLKTYGFLSYNGTYTFEFEYPFFVFERNKIFYQ